MPPAQNPSFVMIGCQKTVLLRNTQYYCSNVQPRLCGCVSFWLWWEIIIKMRTPFYKKILLGYFIVIRYLLGFSILEKQLFSQDMFLVRSELSITVYLLCVLNRSTSLQSLLFLKNIILRPFCANRNWWIIVVFLQRNSLTITIVFQKYWELL